MKANLLPIEFAGLQGKVNYIFKVSKDEYSSSCPQCGGQPHKDGTPPDRFRMWTNATGKNKTFGWCRRCSYMWFPDSDKPLRPEEIIKWRHEQLLREEERKAEAEKAIQNLKSQKLWEFYHNALNTWALEVIQSWGISKEYADYWQLGLIADYVVKNKEEQYHSPAISIPIWGFGWDVKNVKVRILNPRNGNDRYRKIYKLGENNPFVAFPDLKSDTCLIVEGEKKAMVSAEFTDHNIQVIGVPTKMPSAQSLQTFDQFGKLYLCLDPDAKTVEANGKSALDRMAELLGEERVFVVELPGKIDDLVVNNGLREDGIRWAMKNSKKWR